MITVKELIAQLQAYNPDLPVVVGGFDESGYDGLGTIQEVELVRVNEERSHSGEFEEPGTVTGKPGWKLTAKGPPFSALYLDR